MVQAIVDRQHPAMPDNIQIDPMTYLADYGRAKDRITKQLSQRASLDDVLDAIGQSIGKPGSFGEALNALKAQKIKEQMAAYEMERDYAKTALDTYNKSQRLAAGAKDPARVAEYKYFQSLPPEEQQEYLETMWAQQNLNLGDRVIQAPRGGGPGREFKKGVPPQDQPSFRAAVKKAETTGTETAKREFNMSGLSDALDRAEAILTGDQAPTGSYIGWAIDQAGRVVGHSPPGANEAMELETIGAVLTSKVPRMEGPQSDSDTALYKQAAGQVGDRTQTREARLYALRVARSLWGKYESFNTVGAAQPGPAGEAMSLDEYLRQKGK